MIITTDVGLNAISNASAGGFLLNFTEFAVTESTTAVPSIQSKVLEGPVVYRGKITNIEVLSGSSVKLTIEIPRGVPNNGSFNVSELGIYLASGELFAHGMFPAVYNKVPQYGLITYVIVSAARLGEVINVSVPNAASLASTANVRNLQAPYTSNQNAIAVLDEQTNGDGATSASIALKYGAGNLHWAFIGYSRVFHNAGATVLSSGQFRLDISRQGGFWLDDGEVVLAQVTNGLGMGESRRVKYAALNNEFTVLEKAFTALDASSTIAIWRDKSHTLPARLPNIPEYMMLGVGRNTFAQTLVTSGASTMTPHRIDHISTGPGAYALPAGLNAATLASTSNFMVWVAGLLIDSTQFTVAGNSLNITSTVAGDEISIVALDTVPSTGSAVVLNDAMYTADGALADYNLPVVPDTAANVLAFVGNKLVPSASYTVTGALVHFLTPPPAGPLHFVVLSNFLEQSITSHAVQTTVTVATANYRKLDIVAPDIAAKNTVVMFDGQIIDKAMYFTSPNAVEFYANVPIGTKVHVTALIASPVTPAYIAPTGEETGPVWSDPAGIIGYPNWITATGASFVTDGVTYAYNIPAVVDKSRIIAFVGSQLVDPADFGYANGQFVFTRYLPPAGLDLDITCFTETAALDSGCEAQCWTARYNTGGVVYTLPQTVNSEWELCVFVNGHYVPKAAFSAVGNQLTLATAPAAPALVHVWCFKVVARAGWRTEFNAETKYVALGIDHYFAGIGLLDSPISSVSNMLAVIDSTLTNPVLSILPSGVAGATGYRSASVGLSNDTMALSIHSSGECGLYGINAECMPTSTFFPVSTNAHADKIVFVHSVASGPAKTRLMLREEADRRYLKVGPTGRVDYSDLEYDVQKRIGNTRFAYAV